MNKKYLEWDSDFFGINVEKITLNGAVWCFETFKKLLYSSPADVVYIFCPNELQTNDIELTGAIKYDEKVTYKKKITINNSLIDIAIVDVFKGEVNDELENITYTSGIYSRFFLDPKFNPWFEKLYRKWIHESVSNKNGIVFVIQDKDNNQLAAMVAASIDNHIGKIVLLAVDRQYRGKGYAKQLLTACDNWFLKHRVKICEVVTQKANVSACKLYECCGYNIQKEELVYHYWNSKKRIT